MAFPRIMNNLPTRFTLTLKNRFLPPKPRNDPFSAFPRNESWIWKIHSDLNPCVQIWETTFYRHALTIHNLPVFILDLIILSRRTSPSCVMKFQSLAVLALTALAAVPCEGMNKIQSVELLQETVYPTNTVIEGEDFPIGGISGISYDPTRDVYYMVGFAKWQCCEERVENA